jgi:hypothetical protein
MLALFARNWWVLALRGLFAVLFGLAAFVWPAMTLTALVLLFGAYTMADGLFSVLTAVVGGKAYKQWWLLLVQGLAGVAAGVLTFVWPGITALVLLGRSTSHRSGGIGDPVSHPPEKRDSGGMAPNLGWDRIAALRSGSSDLARHRGVGASLVDCGICDTVWRATDCLGLPTAQVGQGGPPHARAKGLDCTDRHRC